MQALIEIDQIIDILIRLLLYIPYKFFFKFDCVLFMFHVKVRIRHCGKFPGTNEAASTELYITSRKNAFDTAEVLKTFEIQQYIGFFVIARSSELFTTYVRHANITPAMRDY